MGLFGGTQVETNMAEFSAESHGLDCIGDSKVLTELQISPSKGNEKKKLLPHRVFVFGHPSRYEPGKTGLNFAERTTHHAVLVV